MGAYKGSPESLECLDCQRLFWGGSFGILEFGAFLLMDGGSQEYTLKGEK